MSVNRVTLIGVVAALPRTSDGLSRFLLATVRDVHGETRIERHRISTRNLADELATGDEVYVEGSLRLDQARRRHYVAAHEVMLLVQHEPSDESVDTGGTHASPVTHERQGHWRRVAIGTPRERLTWVRATIVKGPVRD